jgi:uncharacterized protein (TIGR02118 family)
MIRVTVSYPAAAGRRFDHEYYQTEHRRLLQELLSGHGLDRVEMDKGLANGVGGAPDVVAAAHLIFESLRGFQEGMTEHGEPIRADIANYTDIEPQILISETT